MAKDLTAIFYTSNTIPEIFASKVREHLLSILDGTPLVSVSQKPMPYFGKNIWVGDIGVSVTNIYRQILIGAKEATTEYIALCEDDCLYTKGYFTCFRPKEFSYNKNRWGIFTWNREALYNYKDRCVLNECVARRDKMIEALEERFSKLPQNNLDNCLHEPGRYEDKYHLIKRELEIFYTPEPSVVFSHIHALDMKNYKGLGLRKRMGLERVKVLEPWGDVEELIDTYWGREEWERHIAFGENEKNKKYYDDKRVRT